MNRNILLVGAILGLGGVLWLTIWWMGKRIQRAPAPVGNVLRTQALQQLGAHAVVLSDNLDLTGDGLPDVMAYTPVGQSALPQEVAFAFEQLMVITLDKKKFRTLLTIDAAGLRGAGGAPMVAQVAAPHGYFCATTLDQHGRLRLHLTQRDAEGRPASDALDVYWNPMTQAYAASNVATQE